MKIAYIHASKFGNGAMVAREFRRVTLARGVDVEVHHVKEVRADDPPRADLYVFSSPGRMGRPIRGMRRFLKDVRLPSGTPYALLTTEMAPRPEKKTGRVPTEEEVARFQRVRPIMHELARAKGLVAVGEEHVFVTDTKGPLEDGWQRKVAAFAAAIATREPSAGVGGRAALRC